MASTTISTTSTKFQVDWVLNPERGLGAPCAAAPSQRGSGRGLIVRESDAMLIMLVVTVVFMFASCTCRR